MNKKRIDLRETLDIHGMPSFVKKFRGYGTDEVDKY